MYKIFQQLLDKHGLTVMDVSRATGIPQSTLANWKKRNNSLSAANTKIVADFFHVSVEYLMTGEEPAYYTNPETTATAQELFEQSGMRILFDAAKGSDPEALKLAAEMLRKMKGTNQNG